jgi:hypothetical protein
MLAEKLNPTVIGIDEKQGARITEKAFERKLKAFIRKASPNTPASLQNAFTKEMTRALKAWAVASEGERKATLDKYQKRIENKLLRPRQVGVELGFSKRLSPNLQDVRKATEAFFENFFEVIEDFRTNRDNPIGQLSFQINGIDMNHPKLSIVNCTISDAALRKRELRHGQGATNRRKAGRPATIRLNFDEIEATIVESVAASSA